MWSLSGAFGSSKSENPLTRKISRSRNMSVKRSNSDSVRKSSLFSQQVTRLKNKYIRLACFTHTLIIYSLRGLCYSSAVESFLSVHSAPLCQGHFSHHFAAVDFCKLAASFSLIHYYMSLILTGFRNYISVLG